MSALWAVAAMTDDMIAAVEKVVPCDGYREEPSRDPIQIGGSGRFNSPTVYRCSGDRHIKGCSALLRPSVLALVRERVAEQAFAHRGEMLELQRRMECGHPRACLTRHMQPAATDEKSCSACASVAEARRPLVEALRECSEVMSALVVMITNDMAGDEANGMRRFKSSAFVDVILRARAAVLAAGRRERRG